jgi:hypothetical protein
MENRSNLALECHELRAQLKEWEKSFSDANSGRKPGKEDIKRNPEIEAKYKTYNRTRDVLEGKKNAQSLQRPSPSVRKQKSTLLKRNEKDQGQSPRRTLFATPRKAQHSFLESHPSTLDPYDAPPASISPHPYVFQNAVGPTPQRDGKVLGLFDFLSSSGGTPSTQKRKADVLEDKQNGTVVAQTPSRKSIKANGDLLQHLGEASGGRRHTRTPASDGKKFLLSQFFATPSTTRFATVTEEAPEDAIGPTRLDKTPLRSRVLGKQAKDGAQLENGLETTPAYLKRTTSFNQRLLSASGSNRQQTGSNGDLAFASPSAVRRGPRMHQFKGRGLSEILRGLRQMEDHDDEDEMDALREIEGNERNILVSNSQDGLEHPKVGEEPARTWKKKGQKRSTRRVMMKPTTAPRMPRSKECDELAVDNDVTKVDETQVATRMNQQLAENEDDANNFKPLLEEGENKDVYDDTGAPSDGDNDFIDSDLDLDELDSNPPTKKQRFHPAPEADTRLSTAALARASKKAAQPAETKEKKKSKKGIINPNAHSHQNFRSLKIRNKNSKGKSSGRFGRGKR